MGLGFRIPESQGKTNGQRNLQGHIGFVSVRFHLLGKSRACRNGKENPDYCISAENISAIRGVPPFPTNNQEGKLPETQFRAWDYVALGSL